MGKQTKRRNRKKGGGGASKSNTTSNTATTTSNSSTGSSSLINRIRHGEVRIRHGALSALSSTIFSPESLSKSSNVKMELVQATAERIMDDDAPCALCAVGCMANYILFQSDNTTNDITRVETILTPILLSRMNKACDQITLIHKQMVDVATKSISASQLASTSAEAQQQQQQQQSATTPTTTTKKKKNQSKKVNNNPLSQSSKQLEKKTRMIMEQFSLISLSLHAFCGLVENFASNNSSSSLLYHQRDQFLSTTMKSFIISREMISSLAIATSANASTSTTSNNDTSKNNNSNNSSDMNPTTIVNKVIAKNENEANIISDVAVYAARTIHSSSDDNPEFIKAILSSNSLDAITSSISNTSLPTLSRLHNAGTIIASRHCILELSSSTTTNDDSSALKLKSDLDNVITTQIFPLLSQCTMYSTDIASALCHQIVEMECKLKEEEQDEEMEKNVIRMVDKKKESARLIARRQKEMKKAATAAQAEKKKLELENGNGHDDAMEEDKIADNEKESDNNDMEDDENDKTTETIDKYDKAVNAWKNACLPLKLSVEVMANLCANRSGDDQNENVQEMDDEMGWDSDQEELLLSSANKEAPASRPEDAELFNKIISCGIPDRVLSVFGTILLSLIGSKKEQISKVVLEDMFEVLTKSAICLGNIVCNLDGWKSDETELAAVWKEFVQCLTAAMEGEVAFANAILPCPAISALFSTMAAFLRFRPSLMKSVNEQELQLILSYVLLEAPASMRSAPKHSDRQDVEAISEIQKDAIGLLGILCSEPHPDEVNQRICAVFLTVLSRSHSTSAALMSELMNALMDMYSADEGDPNNHESVFRKNNVLTAFEKCVPILKKKIREEPKPDPMDNAFWKETALNASRFIKYKKG